MELEVVDVRTRRVRKIAQSASQLAPSWSPDGRSIVYQAGGDVYVATLDGSRRRLGRRAAPAFGPSVARIVSGRLGIAYAAPRPRCPGHFGIAVSVLLSGSCDVTGTAKADVIEGTPLWGDRIAAGAGNDQVHANDRHTDRVDCGPGRDTVWADRSDRLAHCEVVHR